MLCPRGRGGKQQRWRCIGKFTGMMLANAEGIAAVMIGNHTAMISAAMDG